MGAKLVLDLGSGKNPYFAADQEVIHLDFAAFKDVEVIFDLQTTSRYFGNLKLPFRSEVFDIVRAYDVIEHIFDVFSLMAEIHRVLKPAGLLFIHTSHYKFPNAFRDPSHYHFFTKESFDYWDPATFLGKKYGFYTKEKFRILEKKEDFQELFFKLQKL